METTLNNWPDFNNELADLDFTNSLDLEELDLEELEFEEFELDLQEFELDLQEFELDYEPPQLADTSTP